MRACVWAHMPACRLCLLTWILFFLLPADTEDVCIVERLFSSSLVAIVSLKAPRKLKVCHFKKGTEICNYSYSNTILAVRLNRQVRPACPLQPHCLARLRVPVKLLTIAALPVSSLAGSWPLTLHPTPTVLSPLPHQAFSLSAGREPHGSSVHPAVSGQSRPSLLSFHLLL